jgi:radical SAM protein with 4Fe4S-binding SPASM domain
MQIYNLEFTKDEIKVAVAENRLLSMEIEFSRICNFRCPYCYVPSRSQRSNELSRAECRDAILQARELGAGKIIILGGEPSIYPHIREMIEFLNAEQLKIEIFTNGSGIDRNFARVLAKNRVRVALKLNSRDPVIQDKLAGKTGAAAIIAAALANLREAGYPCPELFLAISTVICQQNINELPTLWQWLRKEKIEPYFEVITPQENAVSNNQWLNVDSRQLKELFSRLSEIDRQQFGLDWEPQPPLVGNRCMRHQVSCLVTANGEVMPCVGVTIPVGNIRENRLADILRNSEVINNLKNFREMIKGECHDCEKAAECYGCRGAAYQLTGDYLASDPTCWRNSHPAKTGC